MEYVLAQARQVIDWRWTDVASRALIAAILYTGIVYNPWDGLAAAAWWAAICVGCSALSWLHGYRILGFLCAYMILPVFAGTGYGFFRAIGLAP